MYFQVKKYHLSDVLCGLALSSCFFLIFKAAILAPKSAAFSVQNGHFWTVKWPLLQRIGNQEVQ